MALSRNLNMTKDISGQVKKMVADHLGVEESKVVDEANFIDFSRSTMFLAKEHVIIDRR